MATWLALLCVDLSWAPHVRTPVQDRLGSTSCLLTMLYCPRANLPCPHMLHSFPGTSHLYYKISSICLRIKRGSSSAEGLKAALAGAMALEQLKSVAAASREGQPAGKQTLGSHTSWPLQSLPVFSVSPAVKRLAFLRSLVLEAWRWLLASCSSSAQKNLRRAFRLPALACVCPSHHRPNVPRGFAPWSL